MKKLINLSIFMAMALSNGLAFASAQPLTYASFEHAIADYMSLANQCVKNRNISHTTEYANFKKFLHKPLRTAQRKYRVMTNEERKVASQIMLEYSMNPKMVMPRKIFYRKDKSMQAYRCRN